MFFLSGILYYFQKYFSFKKSFVLSLVIAIICAGFGQEFNILLLLVLFISLSRVFLFFAYILILIFLSGSFDILNFSLVAFVMAAVCFYLACYFCLDTKSIWRNHLFPKLCDYENRINLLNHDMGNLLTIFSLRNKDCSLNLVLKKMENTLDMYLCSDEELKYCSLGKVICECVRDLNYNFNVDVQRDLKIKCCEKSLRIFCCCILADFVRFGSRVILEEKHLSFSLKDRKAFEDITDVLEDALQCRVSFVGDRVRFYWPLQDI